VEHRRVQLQRAVEQVLQQLCVDLAAGHALADRRVLVFLQRHAGQADQHQLAAQIGFVHAAVEHVHCRDEALRHMAREVHAQRAVGFGGHRQPADADAVDAVARHRQPQ